MKNNAIPTAIVIAGIIIAGTIYVTKTPVTSPNDELNTQTTQPPEGPMAISENDHILGNPNAPLNFILFSDYDCPACKYFHPSLQEMMEGLGKEGKVNLILRHFPLDSIHPNARGKAEATECAGYVGGEDKFWEYSDKMFESQGAVVPADVAEELGGIDKEAFATCINDKKFADKVQADKDDALNSGAKGTPYYVIINSKGEKFPISNGALPYEDFTTDDGTTISGIKTILDTILAGE